MTAVARLAFAAVAWLLLWPAPASADEAALAPFIGTYVGVAEVFDDTGTPVERRDMDVVITESGRGGFTISWVNVTLVDGRRDVPGVSRRVEQVTFVPGDVDGLYVEERRTSMFERSRAADFMGGDALRWAQITEDRIGVHSLVLLADGRYELQTYQRILTEIGLDILYQRFVDGAVTRVITGHTVRVE